jgi:hypothetical protein|tara:strand:+ start:1623 stop:2774 length:1152 start_codon:yes stop_codon:yes gene_type:complete
MEIKVRAIEATEEKSMQEVENELLQKHEDQFNDTSDTSETEKVNLNFEEDKKDSPVKEGNKEEDSIEEVAEQPYDLKEEDVLSYIGKRYGKEINSFDDLIAEREEAEELPEDVSAYFKYKKETGRGIEDYVKLQRNFDEMTPDSLLKEYLIATEEGLDLEDIDSLMEDYDYDEELDDESVIKKTKLVKKKAIAKAKRYFTEQKELYKQPLESRPVAGSESENEEFKAYKQYLESAKNQQEEIETKKDWFTKKTNEVFDGEFKGFEFTINNKNISFSPGDAQTLKKAQDTPMNFINKYLDENGLVKDAAGYHRSLAIAMNPDKFAQFFYEQGKSEATEDVMRKTKNINMSERRAPEITNKGGMTVKSVNPDSGRGLKIRSIKRK